MNNLERKLIELTFPTVNAEALLEIIAATPNARVATEILCGVYTEPVLPLQKIRNGHDCTLISYDKWEEEIRYSYSVKEKVGAYFPVTIPKGDITLENMDTLKVEANSTVNKYYHSVETDVVLNEESRCSLENWLKSKDIVDESNYAIAG